MCKPFTAADACASGYLCQPIAMKANEAAFEAPTIQFSRSHPRSGGQPVLFDFMGAGDVVDEIEFRFHFQKRSQLFIGVHNKAFGVLTLCSRNPKLSAFVIRAATPAGFAQIASDDFPILDARRGFRLLIVLSHLRSGVIQFEQCAHFL